MATLSLLLVLWAIYLLLAPTVGFAWIDSWHNEQRAVQVALLTLTAAVYAPMAVCAAGPWRARLRLPWSWLVFLAVGVVSALRSQFPIAALAEVGIVTSLGALVALTAALTASHPVHMAKAVAYGALLIATAHVLAVLVRYGAALEIGNAIDVEVFMLGYANPRFASALYAVLMPFVASVAIDTNERRLLRAVALAVLSLLWTINIGLDTRAIWFAYGLAVPAALLLVRSRQALRIAGSLLISAVIGALLYFLLAVDPVGGVASGSVPMLTGRLHTLSSRDVLWKLSWTTIAQNPLIGLGPMHFATLGHYAGAHPHNWPLQIASEWGLPALGLLLFALTRGIWGVRNSLASDSGLNCAAIFAVAVALAYGLVDGNLVMPVSQTASAIALGLALGSVPSFDDKSGYRPIQSWLCGASAAAASAIVFSYALSSFAEQSRSNSAFHAKYPGALLTPRFWEQGQFPPMK